jgi:drug/metabolite transporter (DMT)-like permease
LFVENGPMIVGLGLALGSALGTNVAFLFKQRGAVLAPPVRARHPLRSAVGLFRSRWFSLGWAVAVVAWGLHVGALALAPLSIVQAVLSGGLVFLAVLAERYFGFQLGRRQWTGVIVTAVGLAVIGLTGGPHTSALRHYSPAALIAVECGVFALGAALIRISMRGSLGAAARGLLLGVAAGVLFGVSDIALKYLTRALHGGLHGLVSEWTLAALAASVLAFYASARGLQLGPGVAVIAFTSVAANLAAIMGGILVFRDPIGIGAPANVGRVIAFGLVVAGAAFMPAPVRAGRAPSISPASRQGSV